MTGVGSGVSGPPVQAPPAPLSAVFRQLNTAIAVSQMSSGQCRLAPLIQVIQDCSHLYHYTVKLMFKLHSCESPCPCLPPPEGPPKPPRAAWADCVRGGNRAILKIFIFIIYILFI